MFEDLFNFAENNKDLIELLLKGVESEDSVYQLINETWVKIEEAFQRNIKRATELGILPEKDPSLQSALLISLIEGTLLRWLFGPKDSTLTKKTANELAKEMVRFEFFGLLGI
ncbi:hypothetical protein [Bacillus xiapuensis]|uniref:hypothetical protein n=1 Tax=Bacillus xiapuensis TaxID=2014075 RepID=UPI002E231CC3